jgi:hypothetical protein
LALLLLGGVGDLHKHFGDGLTGGRVGVRHAGRTNAIGHRTPPEFAPAVERTIPSIDHFHGEEVRAACSIMSLVQGCCLAVTKNADDSGKKRTH